MIPQTAHLTQVTQSKSTHAANFGNKRGRKTVSPETHAANIVASIKSRIEAGHQKIHIDQYTKDDNIKHLVRIHLSPKQQVLCGLGNELILRERCNRLWREANHKPEVPHWVSGLMRAIRNSHRMTPEMI